MRFSTPFAAAPAEDWDKPFREDNWPGDVMFLEEGRSNSMNPAS
jgi:hypothetical protein